MATDKQRSKKLNAEIKRQLKRRTRMQEDAIKETTRILKIAQQRIERRLAATASSFDQFILPQVQQSIRDAMNLIGGDLGRQATAKLDDAFDAGIDMVERPLAAGGVQLQGVIPAIDRSQLLALKHFMVDKMKDVTTTMANQINTELGLVAIGGQQTNDAINTIKKIVGDKGRGRAIRVIRTEVLRAYSFASQQRQEQAAKILPGLKKRWLPSGRKHARIHHEAARDQVVDVDKPFTLYSPKTGTTKLMFPRDPSAGPAETINCGCESVPYMDDWQVTPA